MKWALPAAFFASSLLSSTIIEAQATAPAREASPETSSAVLSALVPYDLDGERTIQALSVMRGEARLLASGKRREELNFMRAVALSDLWVIARVTGRDALEALVAQSLGVERAAVPAALDTELAAVDRGVVRDVVGDARQAVRMTQGAPQASADANGFGLRSQSLLLGRVIAAVEKSADAREHAARLSALAEDPCPQASACGPLYKNFDKSGRQAVHALVLASKAVKALDHGGQDPFVMAMVSTFASQARALKTIMLQPNVLLPKAQTRVHATQGAPGNVPDVLVLVSEGRVEYAFTPRVRVDDDGEVGLDESDQPTFPALAEVKIEGTFAPFVRPIDGVVKALAELHKRFPSARVAVGATPEIKAHMVARTLLSAQAAGFTQLAMVGANSEGELRTVELELVGALRASEVGPRELSVVVRLGGFSVKRQGPTVSIPRLKNENGFVFDFASLTSSVRPGNAKSAKLTFMSDVAAETVTEAAFLVAPTNKTLTMVLP